KGVTHDPEMERLGKELTTCNDARKLEIALQLTSGRRQVGPKTFQPENWEVLADATPERLKELNLEPAEVERHVPAPSTESGRPAQHTSVTAADGTGTKDTAK